MRRRRRKRQPKPEHEHRRSIPPGIGTVETCRQTVIDHKTGYRRRTKRGGVPPTEATQELGHPSASRCAIEHQRITTRPERGRGVSEDDASAGPSTLNGFAGTDEN